MPAVELLFYTHNRHKFAEIEHILKREAPWIKLLHGQDAEKIEIQSESLEEIAFFAAETIMKRTTKSFIVEEAGLYIKALNGFPGPYSSYVYKTIGCQGILKLLEDVDVRDALFRSVIVLHYRGILKMFRGEVQGYISTNIKGTRGFGYDPIFIPKGTNQTFAQMDITEKNRVSHRGESTRKLIHFLKQMLSNQ